MSYKSVVVKNMDSGGLTIYVQILVSPLTSCAPGDGHLTYFNALICKMICISQECSEG